MFWAGGGADGSTVALERELLVRGRPYAALRLVTWRPAFTADEERIVDLLCLHAGLAVELAALRGCAEALRRVRAVVGGTEPPPRFEAVREVGLVRLDRVRHEVFVRDVPVHLTPSEFRLLELLTEEPGRAYTREEIVERLWGTSEAAGLRVADVHAGRLRRKLERAGRNGRVVATVRGVGYKLASPQTAHED